MGKVFKTLFGGSSSKAESGNKNLQAVNAGAQPAIDRGNAAGDMLAAMLGFGGDDAAATAATERLADSTGMNFIRDQGSRAVTGNTAAKGLLGSGGTLRRLTEFGQESGDRFMSNLMNMMTKQQDVGTQNLGIMSGAGQYSNSSSESKPGMSGLLGGLMSGGASMLGGLGKSAAGGAAKGLGKAGMKAAPAMSIPFQSPVAGLSNLGSINIPKFEAPRI